jgi:hypothetical protein
MVDPNENFKDLTKFSAIPPSPIAVQCARLIFCLERAFPSLQNDWIFQEMLTAYSELERQVLAPAIIWHDAGSPKLFANRAILSDKCIQLLSQNEFLEMSIEWKLFNEISKEILHFLIKKGQWDMIRKLANPPIYKKK